MNTGQQGTSWIVLTKPQEAMPWKKVPPWIWSQNMEHRWVVLYKVKCGFVALTDFQCDSFVSEIGHLCPQNGEHLAKCENVLMKFGICVQHFPCSAELLVESKMLPNEKHPRKKHRYIFLGLLVTKQFTFAHYHSWKDKEMILRKLY